MDRKQRVNEQIRAPQVRLIGPAGEQFGILTSSDAIAKAREANLDLVEVSPADQPPVVRIMDFGKFKYDKAKRQHKSPGHQSKLKEIRVRPKTDSHDIETKVKQARRFLEARDKVLVTMVFRGRELAHFDEGGRLLAGLISQLEDVAVVETPPARQAKRMSCLLAPR